MSAIEIEKSASERHYKECFPTLDEAVEAVMKEIRNKKDSRVVRVSDKTIGRNDPCFCKSGKKYKNATAHEEELTEIPVAYIIHKNRQIRRPYEKNEPAFYSISFLITSCAGIPPLKVKIKEEFIRDALREAHVRGMLLGYVSERLDYDRHIVVLIRKDPSMNMDLRLRMELIEEDKVYVDAHRGSGHVSRRREVSTGRGYDEGSPRGEGVLRHRHDSKEDNSRQVTGSDVTRGPPPATTGLS